MKKTLFVIVLIAGGLTATSAHADFSASNWKYFKPITVQPLATSSYVHLQLDNQIATTSNSWLDLRVISVTGKEMPYQLLEERGSVENAFYPSEVLNLSTRNKKTTFVIDLGKAGILNNQIAIATEAKNMKRQVTISGSNGNGKWTTLTETGYIYNFSDTTLGFDVGSGNVPYQKNTFQYLRVTISGGDSGPIIVTGAQVYSYEVSSPREEKITVPIKIVQNTAEKVTQLIIDLKSSGIPTYKINLASAETNFSRMAIVEAGDGVTWKKIGEGYIFSSHTSTFSGTQLTLQYPEVREQFLRITILNGENKPVVVKSQAQVLSISRSLVFEAQPQEAYALYYGDDTTRRPQYELMKIFQYSEVGSLPSANIDAQRKNPAFVLPNAVPLPFSERHPHIALTLLFTLLLAVGASAYLYVRKLVKVV